MKNALFFVFFLPLILFARGEFHPRLDYAVQDKYIMQKSSAFDNLSLQESNTLWGKEYYIGRKFATSLDLYQAITSFKRAHILIPDQEIDRKREIEYHIIHAYYLGKKYQDVIDTFEESLLASVDASFKAYHDLLIILFESYIKVDEMDKAKVVLRILEKGFPQTSKKLELAQALLTANFSAIKECSNTVPTKQQIAALQAKKTNLEVQLAADGSLNHQDLDREISFLEDYMECQKSAEKIAKEYQDRRKSPVLAQLFNAILPGSGYLYLGQKQTAFTAFCVNSLFIGSMAYFFSKGNIPAGILATSFEVGWYFGGILGAKENAAFYNERLFEEKAHYRLRDHQLYPALVLRYGF